MEYREKHRWTAAQENYLRENWHNVRDEDIATRLGKTLKSVRRKRERMLLKKAGGRGIVKPLNPFVGKQS